MFEVLPQQGQVLEESRVKWGIPFFDACSWSSACRMSGGLFGLYVFIEGLFISGGLLFIVASFWFLSCSFIFFIMTLF